MELEKGYSGKPDRTINLVTLFFILFSIVVFGEFRISGGEVPLILEGVYFVTALGALIFHGVLTHGMRRLVLLAASFTIIPTAAEWIGVSGGWLFGNYHYTAEMGPMFPFGVPVAIPFLWFVMGYCIHHFMEQGFPKAGKVWKITGAAWLLTAWDLAADPAAVAYGWWVWEDGGAYFGIPVRNFAGWAVIGAISFSVVWLTARGEAFEGRASKNKILRAGPSLAFFFIVFNNVMGAVQRGESGAALTAGMALAPFFIVFLINIGKKKV